MENNASKKVGLSLLLWRSGLSVHITTTGSYVRICLPEEKIRRPQRSILKNLNYPLTEIKKALDSLRVYFCLKYFWFFRALGLLHSFFQFQIDGKTQFAQKRLCNIRRRQNNNNKELELFENLFRKCSNVYVTLCCFFK